ncbi:MAG: RDD family protein [Fimbriimonadales bacterium]
MPQTIKVSTPDHIEFEYHVAGIGTRFCALALDHLLQSGLLLCVTIGFAAFEIDVFYDMTALMLVLIFAILFLYFLLFEWLWAGLTPGKKSVGIRVIYEDGRPLDFAGSAIRNILRLADFLPLLYGLGITTMFISHKSQRLGDMAGGTLVVVQRAVRRETYMAPTPRPSADPQPTFGLTKDDRHAALRFLERRMELGYGPREELAVKLARRIAERANYNVAEALQDPEGFLERVARSE